MSTAQIIDGKAIAASLREDLAREVADTIAPLIVQGTFIFASAILTEATLSFLGAGLPTEIPSWGNMMADGRMYFQLYPGLVLYPGIVLALTLLSVNILGDVLRDVLDPTAEGLPPPPPGADESAVGAWLDRVVDTAGLEHEP